MRDEKSVLPVSAYLDGHYGLYDVCLGVPAIVGAKGICRVLDIPLSAKELSALRRSADTLKQEISQTMLYAL